MIRRFVATGLVIAGLLIAGLQSAWGQEGAPIFAVPAVTTGPNPVELAEPTAFHANAVEATGRLGLSFADISVGARGWPISFGRAYAEGTPDTGLGPGWAWTFGLRLTRNRDTGTCTLQEADGSQSAYVSDDGRIFQAIAGRLDSRLIRMPDGGLRRLYADGSEEIFTTGGALTARRSADGVGYTIERDTRGRAMAIRHEDGQGMTISWNNNRVSSVADAIGRQMQFTYHTGRLASSRDALGRETHYGYDTSGRLERVQFIDGQTLLVEYDLNGRVARLKGPGTLDSRFDHWGAIEEGRLVQTMIDAEGRRYRLEITRDPVRADQLSVVTTDPGGVQTVRDYRDGQVDCSRNGIWLGAVIFDGQGAPSVLMKPEGAVPLPPPGTNEKNRSLAHPDAHGHPRLILDGPGRTAWCSYDAVGRMTATAGRSGRVERFVHDLGNRLVEYRDATDTVTTYEYDRADRMVGWTSGDGRWRKIALSPLGQVVRITGEAMEDKHYEYDRTGRLISMREGAYVWSVEYNASGTFTGLKDATRRGVSYRIDPAGRVVGIDDDYGVSTTIRDDEGLSLVDEVGRVRSITTDKEGRTCFLGAGGARTRFQTLENGDQLVTHRLPDGSGSVERRSPSGALILAETLGTVPFVIETDGKGRPSKAGAPSMPSTLTFDARGLLRETTDPIGVVSTFKHDEKGRLTEAASPYGACQLQYGDSDVPLVARDSDGVTLQRELDPRGRVTRMSYRDGAGRTIEQTMAYDERDRVQRIQIGDEVREFAYAGDTTKVTLSGPGWREEWQETYDPVGRKRTITRPDGTTSTTTYDRAGRPVLIETPVSRIEYELDPEGRILAVTTNGRRTELGPEAKGQWRVTATKTVKKPESDGVVRIDRLTDPVGQTWRVGYDQDGYGLWTEDPTGGVTRVERAGGGQITAVIDPEGRKHYAVHDDLGRTTETGVIAGWTRAYGWKGLTPAGRAYSGGAKVRVEMAEDGRNARSIVNDKADRTFTFDAGGALTSAANTAGTLAFAYGARKLPKKITDVFGRTVTQEFDKLGRLTALVLPEGDRITYAYDKGNTISQTGPDGAVTRTTFSPRTAAYKVALPHGAKAALSLGAGDTFAALSLTDKSGAQAGGIKVETRADQAVTAVTLNGQRREIKLDALGRMVGLGDGETMQTWTYDGSGNVTSANGRRRTYNRAFQLVGDGGVELKYDLDGRLVAQGETRYEYSPVGELIRVTGPGIEIRYAYDALGQLVERRAGDHVEQYLWHDGQLLAVYDGQGRRLALIERNIAIPRAIRVHDKSGSRSLLPDQLGTPLFEITKGRVETLPVYGAWGEAPTTRHSHDRWLGYAGLLQDRAAGVVHMGARTYLPALGRFNAPDPLGIENPANPYIYASLQPLTYVDTSGANTMRLGFGPYTFGGELLNPQRGLPTGPVRNTAGSRRLFGMVLSDLENIAANDPRPHVRSTASRTLHTLRTNGLRMELGHGVSGIGTHANGSIGVNPRNAFGHARGRFGAQPTLQHMVRSVSSTVGHEGTHVLQEAYRRRTGRTLGRFWREMEAMMTGDLLERAVGGYKAGVTDRQAFRQALDYALRTEFRQYLPAADPRQLTNVFEGSGHRPWRGLTQLDSDAIVQMARKYYPNLPAHEALDEFVGAHRAMAQSARGEEVLRRMGPQAVEARNRLVHEARDAASRYRPTPAADPPVGPRPRVQQPQTGRPQPAPQRATPSPRPRPGTTASPRQGPGRTQRLPAADLPAARRTQRLPATDLFDGDHTAPRPSRPSGANPARPARPTAVRRPTQRLRRVPHTIETPPQRGPRPPATNRPPPRNPRPAARPGTRPARPTGTPDRPRVRLRRPQLPTTSTGRRGQLPNRPTVPDAPRPDPGGRRPSARGGRYPIPDLGDSGGGRVQAPPHGMPEGPGGRPPRRPSGSMSGMRDRIRNLGRGLGNEAREMGRGIRHRVRGGLRQGLGPNFGRGLAVLDILVTIYQTDQYIRGEISHQDYWSGMALNGLGYVLPYPLNAAIAAHQIGSFVGTYAANALIDAYRRGDPVARALVNWLRSIGWINANDPTFVAIPEAWPPDLRARAMLVYGGEPQWIPVTLWSGHPQTTTLALVDADGVTVQKLGDVPLSAGATRTFLPQNALAKQPAGLYAIVAAEAKGASRPIMPLRIVAHPKPEPQAGDAAKATTFGVALDVVETRLEPTDLPWERFDRADALIAETLPADATAHGAWAWVQDAGFPGGAAHTTAADAPPVHYALFAKGTSVTRGDNLIQYLWLDAKKPVKQLVIQVYDEALSGAHRISLGADLIAVDERAGFGFVQSGPLPAPGRWMRLRVPLAGLGMDGHEITGVGFRTDGGRALFGPTRLSGAEDDSPRLVEAAGRDVSGAPQSDLTVQVNLPTPGRLTLGLQFKDGAGHALFDSKVRSSQRHFWWQGNAERLSGARVRGRFVPTEGEALTIDRPVPGNPALVARLLYPPQGAVVRQTVPVFGQAGGGDFARYEVAYRPFGGDEKSWVVIGRASTPRTMTDSQIRARIDSIMSSELRGTVHGNLASFHTGSALHRFEFAKADAVMRSGWVEIRLRTFDSKGAFAEAGTAVQIGEVATGQTPTKLKSPDGKASVALPPLVLPVGMGTFSVDLVDQSIPPGAPTPLSAVYGFAPSALRLRAPLQVNLESPTEAQSVVLLDRAGRATVLSSHRDGGRVVAQLAATPMGARFYASAAPPPDEETKATVPAPWFADAPKPGLELAAQVPAGQDIVDFSPIVLDGPPRAMVLSLTATTTEQLALLVRFDGRARLLPIGRYVSGADASVVGPALGLAASNKPQAVFVPLASVLPADARQLERVELVQLVSVAWRTVVADSPRPEQARLHTVAIGTTPATAQAWDIPYNWVGSTGPHKAGTHAPAEQGWHWMPGADGKGTWPIVIDSEPPVFGTPSPADASETAELVVTLPVSDKVVGVDPQSLRLTVNQVAVPPRYATCDATAGRVSVRLGKVPGLRLPSGSEIKASAEIADLLGQRSPVLTWRWRYVAEALAYGKLRQLTVEGGEAPAWLPDGSGFLYQAPRDGQTDIARRDLATGKTTWLTDEPGNDTRPAVAADGRVAYLSGQRLMLLHNDASREIGRGLTDPAWLGKRLIAARGNQVVHLTMDGTENTLCTAAAGASVINPRPAGEGQILFTQQIYHLTIWVGDPATGAVHALSRHPDSPLTRDIDVAPAGTAGTAYVYFRKNGTGGLWRGTRGTVQETMLLSGDGSIDRRATLSPDGRVLLFDSDRTGRREVWALDLHRDTTFHLKENAVSGLAGAGLAASLSAKGQPAAWSLVAADGAITPATLTLKREGENITLTPETDLPEGQWQLQLETTDGLTLRQPLAVDRQPPVITFRRLHDGADLSTITKVASLDRFEIVTTDLTPVVLLDRESGELIQPDTAFSGADLAGKVLHLVAEDAAGNRAEVAAAFAAQRVADALPSPPTEPEGAPEWGVSLLIFLAVLIALVVGLCSTRRKRS